MANWMLLSICFFLALSSHLLDGVSASHRNPLSPRTEHFARANDVDTAYYFDQRVNHKNILSGKFKQRYWVNSKFYDDAGPIFLVSGGNRPGTDSLSLIRDEGIIGEFAYTLHGAAIVLEHRYFGGSFPYNDLSEKSLKRLTVQQSIDDLAYFAQNVKLPINSSTHPNTNPWIIVGAGYAGALANWAMLQHEKVFFAGYASSALVVAKDDLWQYWDFVRQQMLKTDNLKKCSSNIQAVSTIIDQVDNNEKLFGLKQQLQLDNVTYLYDVAASVVSSLELWDTKLPTVDHDGEPVTDAYEEKPSFNDFCKAIAVGDSGNVTNILAAWGKWNKRVFRANNDEFWSRADRYTKRNWADRPWHWLRCNELGWFRTAAPNGPSLVPHLLNIENEQRLCSAHFPKTFRKLDHTGMRFSDTNSRFRNRRADRLIATFGEYDAWHKSGISFPSENSSHSLLKIDNGFISSDISTRHAVIRDRVLLSLSIWLEAWKPKKSSLAWKSLLSKIKQTNKKLKLKIGREVD